LRVVFYAAGTVRQLVTPEFWASGIRITTAAGANAIPVAEYALGVILLSMKRFWAYSAAAKQDRRMPAIVPPPPGNYRRTVGLVSLGRTGRLLAQRLRETELRVLAFDPYINDREARELGVECADLADVFAGSDCVSLHT